MFRIKLALAKFDLYTVAIQQALISFLSPLEKQLAIVREKQKNYTEAIRIAKEALSQGWSGDWERRIVRCKNKLTR